MSEERRRPDRPSREGREPPDEDDRGGGVREPRPVKPLAPGGAAEPDREPVEVA